MKPNFTPQELRANQRFLAGELLARGVEVQVIDWPNEILEARYGDHQELFSDIDSSIMPYTTSIVAGSKSLTKYLLKRSEITVPCGEHFPTENIEEILNFAGKELGFPVVLKPSHGVQGENVHTGLESVEDLRSALQSVVNELGSAEVLVEEHFKAEEFRVFVTRKGEYAVLHREPAYVIGDGIKSIAALAEAESTRRLNPRINCLCAISLDQESGRFLKKQGLCFDSIPAAATKVYLRGSSNVKMGGVPRDVTEIVHPSVIKICRRALSAIPGLPYAGIDFMCADISREQKKDSYRILEINSVPGIGIHMAPAAGKPRNVAAMIVDLIFPETQKKDLSKWAA